MKASSLAVISLALALLPTLCGALRIASARSSGAMFRAYVGAGAADFFVLYCPGATMLALLFAAVGVDRCRSPLTITALAVTALSFYTAFLWLLPAAPMRWR